MRANALLKGAGDTPRQRRHRPSEPVLGLVPATAPATGAATTAYRRLPVPAGGVADRTKSLRCCGNKECAS